MNTPDSNPSGLVSHLDKNNAGCDILLSYITPIITSPAILHNQYQLRMKIQLAVDEALEHQDEIFHDLPNEYLDRVFRLHRSESNRLTPEKRKTINQNIIKIVKEVMKLEAADFENYDINELSSDEFVKVVRTLYPQVEPYIVNILDYHNVSPFLYEGKDDEFQKRLAIELLIQELIFQEIAYVLELEDTEELKTHHNHGVLSLTTNNSILSVSPTSRNGGRNIQYSRAASRHSAPAPRYYRDAYFAQYPELDQRTDILNGITTSAIKSMKKVPVKMGKRLPQIVEQIRDSYATLSTHTRF